MKFLSKKKNSSSITGRVLITVAASAIISQFAWSQPTQFSNIGSIANTRHNMTQSTIYPSEALNPMRASRNNYGEVCVYCHTPHGANNAIAAPLWNRTIKATNYQTYDELGTTTLTQAVTSTPGPNSLTCLSCHDGQTAIDSIINMPGSGMGLISQQTTQNNGFLNSWPPSGGGATQHLGLNSTGRSLGNTSASPGTTVQGDGQGSQGCLACHADPFYSVTSGSGPDFRMFLIGTDLRNDHPIGVTFPVVNGSGTDWNTPVNSSAQGTPPSMYFANGSLDTPAIVDGNGRMDKEEIRLYDGKVECASCHDPHGVPSGGPGTNTVFNKTFLRKQNTEGSQVCLTCHNK